MPLDSQANEHGQCSFLKPISCHLYPIRESQIGNRTILNYDEWSICSAACILGQKEKIPVFMFLKQALMTDENNLLIQNHSFYQYSDH